MTPLLDVVMGYQVPDGIDCLELGDVTEGTLPQDLIDLV